MNALELQNLGLEEMNEMEMVEVDGGWIWIPIAVGMLLYSQAAY